MLTLIAVILVAFSHVQGSVPAQGSDPCKGTYSGANCYSNSEISQIAGLFGKTLINGGPCFMSTDGALAGLETCFVRVDIADNGGISVGYEACDDPVVCKFGDGSGGGDGGSGTPAPPPPPPPPAPEGCNIVALDADDITDIVNKHNALRADASAGDSWTDPNTGVTNVTLSPSANPIPDLTWDADLATGAESWAQYCPTWVEGHDSNSDRQSNSNKNGYVGQNMAWSWASWYRPDYPLDNHIQGWYDEIMYMSDTEINNYPSNHPLGVIGHYTQVVWEKTLTVGCAKAQWPKDGDYYELLVCNYYPGGNYLNEPVYGIAQACSVGVPTPLVMLGGEDNNVANRAECTQSCDNDAQCVLVHFVSKKNKCKTFGLAGDATDMQRCNGDACTSVTSDGSVEAGKIGKDQDSTGLDQCGTTCGADCIAYSYDASRGKCSLFRKKNADTATYAKCP